MKSCLQYLESTWRDWSVELLGYVAPVTETNEMYVATLRVQGWLDAGYSEDTIFKMWNGGDGKDKSGVNQHGVPYNTVVYADKALGYYHGN